MPNKKNKHSIAILLILGIPVLAGLYFFDRWMTNYTEDSGFMYVGMSVLGGIILYLVAHQVNKYLMRDSEESQD